MRRRKWSSWATFDELHKRNFDESPDEPGVYEIASACHQIHRVCGGGQGRLALHRHDNRQPPRPNKAVLRRSQGPEERPSRCRVEISQSQDGQLRAAEKLEVRRRAEKKTAAVEVETKLLFAYLNAHCEMPPLNRRLPWPGALPRGCRAGAEKDG